MHTRIVILAAGRGTRMNTETPKVLIPLRGKPMIKHLLDAVVASGVDQHPLIITGWRADMVEQTLGPAFEYVRQHEQLGTGHAVRYTEPLLKGRADAVIVLNGDHPFVRGETIARLRDLHARGHCAISMMTVSVDNFEGWRAPFVDFARIVRDKAGKIARIVEVRDATDEERARRELNPTLFCFNGSWLWENLKKIDNKNAKGEYYLTDLIGIAIAQGECIASLPVDPREAIGLNTPDHVRLAEPGG